MNGLGQTASREGRSPSVLVDLCANWEGVALASLKNGTLRPWCGRHSAAVHRLDGAERPTHANNAQFTAQTASMCIGLTSPLCTLWFSTEKPDGLAVYRLGVGFCAVFQMRTATFSLLNPRLGNQAPFRLCAEWEKRNPASHFLFAQSANLCADLRQKSQVSPPMDTPTPAKNYPYFFEKERYITKKRHIFVKTCVFSVI